MSSFARHTQLSTCTCQVIRTGRVSLLQMRRVSRFERFWTRGFRIVSAATVSISADAASCHKSPIAAEAMFADACSLQDLPQVADAQRMHLSTKEPCLSIDFRPNRTSLRLLSLNIHLSALRSSFAEKIWYFDLICCCVSAYILLCVQPEKSTFPESIISTSMSDTVESHF